MQSNRDEGFTVIFLDGDGGRRWETGEVNGGMRRVSRKEIGVTLSPLQ